MLKFYHATKFTHVPLPFIHNVPPDFLHRVDKIEESLESAHRHNAAWAIIDLEKKAKVVADHAAKEIPAKRDKAITDFMANYRCYLAQLVDTIMPDMPQLAYFDGSLLSVHKERLLLNNLWSPDKKHPGILRSRSGVAAEVFRSSTMKRWGGNQVDRLKALRAAFNGPLVALINVRYFGVDSMAGVWMTEEWISEMVTAIKKIGCDGVCFCDFHKAAGKFDTQRFDPDWPWAKALEARQ